ncbi:MAG: hypothetical protein L0211_07535 [Planctomycetaceae bacterium]|nr:hypothetical protein [Planctomycetaceae bacterium]
MASISKPTFVAQKPPLCPVCGKPSYSLGGVHPQCAVSRADKVRKASQPPPKPKPAAASGQWKKTCPRCHRQVAARRYTCECGHTFGPSPGR